MSKKFSVIIPAAGKATRLRPLSNTLSKAMVPINGKPIISYIIDEIFKIGTPENIIIVQNELNDIESFVSKRYSKWADIFSYVTQHNQMGPLHALEVGYYHKTLQEQRLLIWLGDTIWIPNQTPDLSKDFVVTSDVTDYQRWCLIDADNNLFDKPTERPDTNKALIGVYNFKSSTQFHNALTEGMIEKVKGEYQISSALTYHRENSGKFELVNSTQWEEWFDCGELQTYYKSKNKLLSKKARYFNNLEIDYDMGTVIKSTKKDSYKPKIILEAKWFEAVSNEFPETVPNMYGYGDGTVELELLPGSSLDDMWVYDNLTADTWNHIINKIVSILVSKYSSGRGDFIPWDEATIKNSCHNMFMKNPLNRVKSIPGDIFSKAKVNKEAILNRIQVVSSVSSNGWQSVIHGDSHLGNILFEPATFSIKFVDPRGYFGDCVGTAGNVYYDLAKLAQDIIGGYAHIVAENYSIEGNKVLINTNQRELAKIQKNFKHTLQSLNIDYKRVFGFSGVLLASCIPFHSDNEQRQVALLMRANEILNIDYNG